MPIGLDCSVTALRKAKAFMPEARVVAADVHRLPFGDETFEACLSFGVIEHFAEGPDAALREALRVVAPHGVLLLSVPHPNLLGRIAPPLKAAYRWLRRLPQPGTTPEPPGTCYTRAALTRALDRTGWRVVEVVPFGHAYTFHSFCGLFRKRGSWHDVTRLGVALGRMAARVLPWAMAFALLIAAYKVSDGEGDCHRSQFGHASGH